VSDADRDRTREQLIQLYHAAVAGANVERCTADAVATLPLERRRRVWLFAFGKAAHAMAAAATVQLQRALAEIVGGVVVAPTAGKPPCGTVSVMIGDHPVPSRASFAAAKRIETLTASKRGGDLGLVLLSGGASSLIAAPLRGMREDDLTRTFELLLGSGLDIHAVNAVRKRFSRWAAGRLALALAPASTHCFAVSDVPGDDLASIGSGPCVPDPITVQRVIDILRGAQLLAHLPVGFQQFLTDSARGAIPETPKATHPAFAHVQARVIANNSLALQGAATAARNMGCDVTVHPEPLVGDVGDAASRITSQLAVRRGVRAGTAVCHLWGGETTVTLTPGAPPGGRCQQLALAAAGQLATAREDGATLLVAGTDGRDGTTDAAGAVVDRQTWNDIVAAGVDPAAALRTNASHDALSRAGALFTTGPTGTNVMDVTIALVRA
jgi:glycerate 2-kinase